MYTILLVVMVVLSASWSEAYPKIRVAKVQYSGGDDVTLTCEGNKEMVWTSDIVPQVAQNDPNLKITSSMRNGKHVSTYTYKNAGFTATGRYICAYKNRRWMSDNTYIFVYEKYSVFRYYSKAEYENPNTHMFVKDNPGNTTLIPCLGTHVGANGSLFSLQGNGKPFTPIIAATYDPAYGFNAYFHDFIDLAPRGKGPGILMCKGRVGNDEQSKIVIAFQPGKAPDIGPMTTAISPIHVGDDVEIFCEAIDEGSCPTVAWSHSNTAGSDRISVKKTKCVHFSKSGYYSSSIELKIKDIKKADEGKYKCTATYASGTSKSGKHTVNVEDKAKRNGAPPKKNPWRG